MKLAFSISSLLILIGLLNSCAVASIAAVPVKIAGKAATTTIGVAGKAAEGAIDLVTSDESDEEEEEE